MLKEKEAVEEGSVDLSNDQLISLMGVYLSEWEHRDNLLWTQVFKYFYANLIIIVLPYAASFLQIRLPKIDSNIFPIIGILMGFVFLYVSLGYAMRLKASSQTYVKIMKLLKKEEYQRISISDRKIMKWGYLFSPPMANVVIITMFFTLEAIAVTLLII